MGGGRWHNLFQRYSATQFIRDTVYIVPTFVPSFAYWQGYFKRDVNEWSIRETLVIIAGSTGRISNVLGRSRVITWLGCFQGFLGSLKRLPSQDGGERGIPLISPYHSILSLLSPCSPERDFFSLVTPPRSSRTRKFWPLTKLLPRIYFRCNLT